MALHTLLLIGLFADLTNTSYAPDVLDRIVAVVDEQPILLSQLRRRVRPQMAAVASAPSADAAKRLALFRDVLERMIDERLEERAAGDAHITVSSADIDSGLQAIATQAKISVAELFVEVKRQGYSDADYRDEIRRQILEGKLIQLRVRSRVRVSEADAQATYATWVKEQTTGPDALVDLRIIIRRLPADASAAAKKAEENLATQIATQARVPGADFCSLVTKHSQNPSTTSTCGSQGPVQRSLLLPEIAKATESLKPGETLATPLALESTLLVIQRSPTKTVIPNFPTVKEKMMERAFFEATERERKLWLKELRKPAFIDVRM